MKLFVLALFGVALDSVLLPLAGWILNWMAAWSQVVFVMAVFPLLMNIIQVGRSSPTVPVEHVLIRACSSALSIR